MKAQLVAFGSIEIDGRQYDHDVVIDQGAVRKRVKKPSKPQRTRYGHTPLSADEDIPWGGSQLIVGTGAYGSLPDHARGRARRPAVAAWNSSLSRQRMPAALSRASTRATSTPSSTSPADLRNSPTLNLSSTRRSWSECVPLTAMSSRRM